MLLTLQLLTGTPTGRAVMGIGAAIMGLLLLLSANGRRVRKLEQAKQLEKQNATLKRMAAARANTSIDRADVVERLHDGSF